MILLNNVSLGVAVIVLYLGLKITFSTIYTIAIVSSVKSHAQFELSDLS